MAGAGGCRTPRRRPPGSSESDIQVLSHGALRTRLRALAGQTSTRARAGEPEKKPAAGGTFNKLEVPDSDRDYKYTQAGTTRPAAAGAVPVTVALSGRAPAHAVILVRRRGLEPGTQAQAGFLLTPGPCQ